MLKRCFLGLLCILITGAVFAAGNAASSGGGGKEILLRYGNSYAPDHPTNVASKKFIEIVEPIAGPVPVPASLQKAMERKAQAKIIPNELDALREIL